MASYISKVDIGGTIYSLKDAEAQAAVATLAAAVASSLVFKGVVADAAGITGLTNYKLGWTYKATEIFAIADVGVVEPGDMIVCINSNSTYDPADWTIVQNNIDTMVGATSSSNGTRGLVPAPTSADRNKFLCGDGTWATASGVEWGSFSDLSN